jgi:hypothetical protein
MKTQEGGENPNAHKSKFLDFVFKNILLACQTAYSSSFYIRTRAYFNILGRSHLVFFLFHDVGYFGAVKL